MDLRDQLQLTLGMPYTIERELGGGGMSRVFVATETALGRKVVVKLLAPELTAAINVDRFKREILVAAKLQHPHIVPVLASGESNGLPYYTMPFVEGESVRARLSRGPLTVTEAVSILRDVARALAYAHEHGIVHRDIKPDNVLISGGSATVTDFGIAKALSAAKRPEPDGSADTSLFTALGTSIGTPAYMAPEQAAADPATDHRADIYAFGCMAYELLAGHPPFVERTPQRLLAAQMAEVPRPVRELRPDTPPILAELVMRCLEKNADVRPQSAGDLARVLETVGSDGRHPALAGIAGAGMLRRALFVYAAAFIIVAIVAKAAIVGIGLPDWVFPGSLIVMALGLPVILVTAYVHHETRRAFIDTPTLTPGGSEARRSTGATLAVKASPHLTWRRTTLGGAYAFGVFILVVGIFMLLRGLGVGPVGSLLASGKLKDREPLVIADFAVTNTDSALGAVVSDAVRAGLAQSPVISLVSSASVGATLRLMNREPTSRVGATLAREIAQRQGVKAVVDGTVTGVSGGYIVSLRLVTADSGIVLASFRESGDGPRGLIDAADHLARQLRAKVGESLKSVQASPPLGEVTTASLDALRKWSAGFRANNVEGNFRKAVELRREAVAIDSTFGSAWRGLAISLLNSGAPASSVDSAMEHAYRYRDHMTEDERLSTVANYYLLGSHRDRTKAILAYEAVAKKNDRSGRINIGTMWQSRRFFARAESIFAVALGRDSSLSITYINSLEVQLDQGHVADARRTLDAGKKRFVPTSDLLFREALLVNAEGGPAAAERFIDSVREHSDPSLRADAAGWLAPYALLHGRLGEARRLAAEANAGAVARGARRVALTDSLNALRLAAWFSGPSPQITRATDAAIAAMPFRNIALSDRPYDLAARVYALAGRPDRAREVLAERQRAVTDTALIRQQQADVHRALAEIALAEHQPAIALDAFRKSDIGDDGFPERECGPCITFNLARAFDTADQRDSAIVAYERYIAEPYYRKITDVDGEALAGTHKRLGELYEAKGDRQNAIAHYSAFVEVWKNADLELQPKVSEVKRRLTKLAASGR